MRKVDTYITYVRGSVPHDIGEIASLLAQHQWALSVNGTTHVDDLGRYLISAETSRWADLPVGSYAVGYYAPDGEEKSIIKSARRLAELCLRLREVFSHHLPATTISEDGQICEDVAGTEYMKKGALPLLHYLSDNRAVVHADLSPLTLSRGFIQLKTQHGELLLSEKDLFNVKEALYATESC